jgi:hypothetical protein
MFALGLNIVELLEIVRVCGTLRLEKCPASFLSDYLAASLAPRDPDLAAKLRGFDEDELDQLAECVRELRDAQHARSTFYAEAIGQA